MQIRVNPTRMALLRLRKRLTLARRGHKLLKDKLEGLVQEFMPLVERYGTLRREVDRELPQTLRLFTLAGAVSGEEAVNAALEEIEARLEVEIAARTVMSVAVPRVDLKGFQIKGSYSTVTVAYDFDRAAASLRGIFPRILELAGLEEEVLRMAEEIEKTRRRVNALEHVLIPALGKAIKGIASKLDEADRSDRARLMKVKDLVRTGETGR